MNLKDIKTENLIDEINSRNMIDLPGHTHEIPGMFDSVRSLIYISESKPRRNHFKDLVEEKKLSTDDILLILTTVGLNPDRLMPGSIGKYTILFENHPFYERFDDPIKELLDF